MARELGSAKAAREWRILDRVAWTDAPGRTVILPLDRGDATPLALEGSAHQVWGVLAERGPVSMDDLVDQLATGFDVEPTVLREDVASLLAELRSRGVLICV